MFFSYYFFRTLILLFFSIPDFPPQCFPFLHIFSVAYTLLNNLFTKEVEMEGGTIAEEEGSFYTFNELKARVTRYDLIRDAEPMLFKWSIDTN